MKFKVKRDIKHHETRLIVSLGKKDELDFAHAELLHGGAFQSFLPFDFIKRNTGYRFMYRADGHISLEALRRRVLNSEQFKTVMNSFLTLLKTCEESGFLLQRVTFAPDLVFYSKTSSELCFAYIPVKSYTFGQESFQTCIAYLCENLNLESDLDKNRAKKIYSFVNTSPIAASIDFESCLRNVELLNWDKQLEQSDVVDEFEQGINNDVQLLHNNHAWNFVEPKEFTPDSSTSSSRIVGGFSNNSLETLPSVKLSPIKSTSNFTVCYTDGNAGAINNVGDCDSHREVFILRRRSTGESWVFEPGTYEIGRHSECDIILRGAPRVSRKHASVTFDGVRLTLRDLGSQNGTYIKGKRLQKGETVFLENGSFFEIGGECFEVIKQKES